MSTHGCMCACIHTDTPTGEWRSRKNGVGDRTGLPTVYIWAYLSLSIKLESFSPTNSPEFLICEQVICLLLQRW